MLLILFLKKTEDDYTYVLGHSIQTTNGRGYFGLSVYKYREREREERRKGEIEEEERERRRGGEREKERRERERF